MYKTLKSLDMFASSVFTGNRVFEFSGEVLENSLSIRDDRALSPGMGREDELPGIMDICYKRLTLASLGKTIG